MKYRKLGADGPEVSVLSFGAWPMGDTPYWGEDDQANAEAAVHTAIDEGINLFDTAEGYGAGDSEKALGRFLGAKRDQVLIATKVGPDNCAPDRLRNACEASLERLGTDYIDLYQIHWPFRDVPFEAAAEVLLRLKEEGKIRAIGVSNFGPIDLEAWLAVSPCASNQLGYNLVFPVIEHEIVPACLRHDVAILVYMPLAQGILSCRWKSLEDIPQARRRTRHFAHNRSGVRHNEPGCEELLSKTLGHLDELAADLACPPATLALAWVMDQPGVTSVIIGARNPAQLQRNTAVLDFELDDATRARLDALSQPFKEVFGKNADMWCDAETSRIQ